MGLLILILCIISMTPFNPVASSSSTQLSSDSAPVVDFGFSRLIDNLVSSRDYFTNRKALNAVFSLINKHIDPDIKSGEVMGTIDTDDETLHRYVESAKVIETLYGNFEMLLKYGALIPDSKWKLEKLINQSISLQSDGLHALLREFQRKDEATGKNFMDALIEYMNFMERDGACWYTIQSPQQKISLLYHELVIITVRAYAMRIYAYNLLRINSDEYSEQIKNERKEYETTLRNFEESAVLAIPRASREFRSCDYEADEKGNKFIELKWLFNPIAINEVYLNEKSVRCWDRCPDYKNATFHQYESQPDVNQCPGRLYNCFRETVDVCDPSANYHKRHFNNSDVSIKKRDAEKLEGWCRSKKNHPKISNGVFTRCDTCICYCGDHDRSDIVRTFSTRLVTSDTSKNRVITGIQFVEINQTIYLRIQEGELRPTGTIEKSTVKWQPVNEIDWKSPFLTEYDFFMITNNEKYVNLDTLVVPKRRVLTGISLHAQGSHLALQIRSHAYNYSTGILQGDYWVSNPPVPRQEIMMTAADSPLFMDESVVDTRANTYVTFQKTDYEKDAAQTTIPLIDALPVASDPPVPLCGAGIYFSGQTGYGGFIGLKAVTHDHSEYITK